jgi:hypothetical protein
LILVLIKGGRIASEALPTGLLLGMELDMIFLAGLPLMSAEGGKLSRTAIRSFLIYLMV